MSVLWTALASAMSALLVLLLWPPAPLERLATRSDRAPFRLPKRWRARPDALPARLRRGLGGACALGVYVWLLDVGWYVAAPVALVAGAAAAIALGQLEPTAAVRRREHLVATAPQALRLMAACVGVGLPIRRAAAAVAKAMGGPVGAELEAVLAHLAVGVSEPDAWLSLRDHPVLGGMARDVARAVESGTAVQAALFQRADELQSDHRSAVETRAKAVGVRTVLPLTLCFLPAFFLLGVVPVVAGLLLPILGT